MSQPITLLSVHTSFGLFVLCVTAVVGRLYKVVRSAYSDRPMLIVAGALIVRRIVTASRNRSAS